MNKMKKLIKIVLSVSMSLGIVSYGNVSANSLDNQSEVPNLSFFALSDVHLEEEGATAKTYEGLKDALEDITKINPNNAALVIPGDLTQYGTEAQYKSFFDLLKANPEVGQPMLALGNHDVRWLCSVADRNPASPNVPTCKEGTSPFAERYLKYNQEYMGDVEEGQLYFDQWINGYHFITLNTEKDLKDIAYLSDEQLSWLDEKLAKDADINKPIFVNIHQAFSDATYQPDNEEAFIGEKEAELRDILKKYPQVVVMTGHTHPSMDSAKVYNTYFGHVVEIPGLYYNNGIGNKKGRIGYQINVFDDYIQFKLYDFENNVWLEGYEHNFKLTDMDIDKADDSFDLSVADMTATAGSEAYTSGSEGPAKNVLDGNISTKWHTKYGTTPIENNWINIHLSEKQIVNGVRYLPRQDSGVNGIFLEYEVYVSSDNGQTYTKISSGSFENNKSWQIALFDSVEVTDVKLQPTKTATSPREYGSAAEIRLCNISNDVVDKTKLEALLTECELIIKEDYLDKNWDVYEKNLVRAKHVYENKDVSQAEINYTIKLLTKAIDGLLLKPTKENPIIFASDAQAGSTYGANQPVVNVINNSGMSDVSLEGKHDNNSSARTMWHTATKPGSNAWVEVDLGTAYLLNEMWVWNMNQLNNTNRGLKNVKIEYSLDKEYWNVLSPEKDMAFAEATSKEYPFQFAQASGESLISATNLNDGKNTPVRFNGKRARYIRISADPTVGVGSWGSDYYGLSELKFTAFFGVDKTELQELVDYMSTLDSNTYTKDSWDKASTALEEARMLLKNEDVTQEEIADTVENLKIAERELLLRASSEQLEALKELVRSAEEIDSSAYNEEGYALLTTEIEKAKEVLEKDKNNLSSKEVETEKVNLKGIIERINAFYKVEYLSIVDGISGPYYWTDETKNAFDKDVNTMWHSKTSNDPNCNWIILDLGEECIVNGLRYLPRQDYETGNGNVSEYEVYVGTSVDALEKVASGNWGNGRNWKETSFEGRKARYVKFVGVKGLGGHTSAAELVVTGLKISYADYSKVDEAIANVPADLTVYTEESVAALQAALDAVVRGFDSSKQAEVDAMAEAINVAVANLEKAVYTITVDGEVVATGKYNTRVTVEAEPVEGKEFTAWLLDGKVVSTDAKYTFFISEDMDLETCYEEIEVSADAILTNTILTKRDTKADVKFVAQLVLPEGYTVENAGLVWSSKEDANLSLENTNLKPTYISKISTSNQFSVTIKGMPAGKFIRGKIFATLVDSEGNTTTVYSEEARVVNK